MFSSPRTIDYRENGNPRNVAKVVCLVLLGCATPIRDLTASTPTPPPTGNTVVNLYYDHQSPAAVALAGSSSTTIRLATWRLTDGTLCQALSIAASRGVNVQVAYDGSSGTNDAQYQATASIRATGGTVYACQFPKKITNNFLVGNGNYTLQGNYYYSPTAVQIGSYSMAVSGTEAAAAATTTFATLISGGTITAFLAPLIEDHREIARQAVHQQSQYCRQSDDTTPAATPNTKPPTTAAGARQPPVPTNTTATPTNSRPNATQTLLRRSQLRTAGLRPLSTSRTLPSPGLRPRSTSLTLHAAGLRPRPTSLTLHATRLRHAPECRLRSPMHPRR